MLKNLNRRISPLMEFKPKGQLASMNTNAFVYARVYAKRNITPRHRQTGKNMLIRRRKNRKWSAPELQLQCLHPFNYINFNINFQLLRN